MSLRGRLFLGFALVVGLWFPLNLALDYRLAEQMSRDWMQQQSALLAELLEEKLQEPLEAVAAASARSGHSGHWQTATLDLERDQAISWVESTGRRVPVPLSELRAALQEVPHSGPGYVFLLDRHGTFLALHAMSDAASAKLSPEQTRQAFSASATGSLLKLDDPWQRQPSDIVVVALPRLGLAVGVLFPDQEITERLHPLAVRLLQAAAILCALAWLLCYGLASRITRPLENLTQAVARTVEGEPDALLVDTNITEVAQLGEAFSKMRADLDAYLEQLTRNAGEMARVDRELELARTIQGNADFRVCAGGWQARGKSQAAREVGGDFMDAFLLPDKSLAVLIGDVSGKGIPAALHTLLARSGLKLGLQQGGSPGAALGQANSLLAVHNPDLVFVSALVAVLNPAEGVLVWARAGHPAPLTAQGPLAGANGPPLGLLESAVYQETRTALGDGTLLFYTDGFPEAENEAGEFLHLSALQQALASAADVWTVLGRHRGRAEPGDDATAVLLERLD